MSSQEEIDAYKDYTFIMYTLCDKTASFYSKIKNVINIPIVICSTGLSILNTTSFDQDTDRFIFISYLGIVLNLLIAMSVATLNVFKITEKEFSFKSHSMNFLKLHNKINAEIAKCKTIMIDIDILSIINEYNLLCEYITFHIPSRIRRDIQKHYPYHKMPILLTNTKKEKFKLFTSAKDTYIPSPSDTVDTITSSISNTIIHHYVQSPFSIIGDSRKRSPIYAVKRLPLQQHTEGNLFRVTNPSRSLSPLAHPSSPQPRRKKRSNSFSL
jgi:hypothetical protein